MFVDPTKRLRSSKPKDSGKAKMTDIKMQLPVCPLTLELPTDPVVASDGKVYDSSAWKQYKKSMKTRKKTLVSPVTKQRIKGKVYPAVDIKTMIEDAVKNGHVPDDLCSRWKDKISQEAKFQQMVKDAQKDPALMDKLGDCYNYGTDTPQCYAEAIKCYTRSLEHNHLHFESKRKLSILMCLRPKTTRTDIINSWATICTLDQMWQDPRVHSTLTQTWQDPSALPSIYIRVHNMIKLVLKKLSPKLRSHIKTGFVYDIDEDDTMLSVYDKNEKQQVDKWVKELAHFLKDNSKSTRADDESDDDDDDDDDDAGDDDSELGSEWEEYDPNFV